MNTTPILEPLASPPQHCIEDRDVPALCVDLDYTLVQTDTFIETLIVFLKQSPWLFFLLPFWAIKGKAYLKRQIADRGHLDVTNLPYRSDILGYLNQEFDSGRKIYLTTDADRKIAEAIAKHVNIFSGIFSSDGRSHFSGSHKSHVLKTHFGIQGFDYLGGKNTDHPIFTSGSPARSSNNPASYLQHPSSIIPKNTNYRFSLPTFLKALRVHQWIKNTLLFLPLAGAHLTVDVSQLFSAGMAFLSFSFCASSLYIFNDLIDLPADRRHPKKRARPFASGALPLKIGLFILPLFLIGGFSIAFWTLPPAFVSILGFYCFMTVSYSLYLKKLLMIDVLTLAGFYTLRVFAGGLAAGIPVSSWLLAFCLFFFLSLAFSKRYSELQFRKVSTHQGVERRAYIGGDKEMIGTMGTISGYLSVLVLALYINSQEVASAFQTPDILWLACPLLLYWVSRTWMLAHRGSLDDDPLVTAFHDPRSYVIGMAMGILGFLAL